MVGTVFLWIPALCYGQAAEAPPSPVPQAEEEASDTAGDEELLDDEFLDEELDTLYEEAESATVKVADPFEPINRGFFVFNDRFYFWFAKPVTIGYRTVIPSDVRSPIRNFFFNVFAPIRIVNNLLQGKFKGAGIETQRFFINTTAGVLGFGDPASSLPQLAPRIEDLGQTFAVWGIGNGFYIVLPFIGPTTLRDTTGWVLDRYFSPLAYVYDSWEEAVAVTIFRRWNELSFRIGDYEALKAAAIDPYVAMRNGYIQFRNTKIKQ